MDLWDSIQIEGSKIVPFFLITNTIFQISAIVNPQTPFERNFNIGYSITTIIASVLYKLSLNQYAKDYGSHN
jgi:hypothetical protein